MVALGEKITGYCLSWHFLTVTKFINMEYAFLLKTTKEV
jgi:hypothetical protein